MIRNSAKYWLGLAPWALVAILVAPVYGEDSEEDEPKPPPPVMSRHVQVDQGRTFDAVLPGEPISVAKAANGKLAVLIFPEEEDLDAEEKPRPALFLLDLDPAAGAQELVPHVSGLPSSINTLVYKGSELWLGGEDVLYRLPADASRASDLETLLELPGLDVKALKDRGLIPSQEGLPLAVPELGRLTLYQAEAGGLRSLYEAPLPLRTRRRSRGFEMSSPSVLPVVGEGPQASTDLWGTTTEPVSDRRFRAQLIRLGDGDPESWLEENFFRFNGPEDIQQHHWVTIDGRTALIVATTPGDKLGIFQKLKLRVFYTGADRTRAGRKPTTEFQTVTRRWYSFKSYVDDATGDGKDDLILVQDMGMSGDNLAIDVFPGKGNGRFHQDDPFRTKLEDFYGGFHFGTDFNGDGRADFILRDGRELNIHSVDTRGGEVLGAPYFTLKSDRRGQDADPETTVVTVSASGSGVDTDIHSFSTRGRLNVMAVDDQGPPEIVLLREYRGRTVVRVIWVQVDSP